MNEPEGAAPTPRPSHDSLLPFLITLVAVFFTAFCGALLIYVFFTPGNNVTDDRIIDKKSYRLRRLEGLHEEYNYKNCTNQPASSDRCNDFYSYATNIWIPLEPDLAKKSTMFLKNLQMLSLLTDAYSNRKWRSLEKTASEEKAVIFFETCINTDEILNDGLQPLRTEFLDFLNGWPLIDENWTGSYHLMVEVLATLDKMGFYNGLFTVLPLIEVFADKKLAHTVLITPSTSLIDITFDGEATDNEILSLVQKFGKHPTTTTQLSEMTEFKGNVKIINEKYRRDIQRAVKSSKKLSDLTAQTKFDWNEFFLHSLGKLGIDTSSMVYLFDDEYIAAICNLVLQSTPRTVVNYAIWTALKRIYAHTSAAIARTYPRNYFNTLESGGILFAQRKILCMHYQTTLLSYATTRTLIDTFDLSDETSIFDTMKQYYHHPKWLEDTAKLDDYYSDVKMTNTYLTNFIALTGLLRRTHFQKLIKNNTLETWLLSPLDVNAYCLMAKNQIVVPISLISFIERNSPMALLYSTIGFIIAHEMMHSFDPAGIKYNKDGKDRTVLDAAGIKYYALQESCLYNQYYDMCLDKEHEMGEYAGKTLGENFADNLGLRYSYYAYTTKWLPYNKENMTVPFSSLTPEKLFFFGVAYLWYDLPITSVAEFKEKLEKDVHSPAKFRVNGPLQNLKEFSEVFNCPSKSPMNRRHKCIIW